MDCQIRRIRTEEGLKLKAIRLRALSDAPGAFGSTYAEEVSRPDSDWDRAAESRSAGVDAATFVADTGGHWAGIAAGFREDGSPELVHLVSMWVEPGFRRFGLGRRLVETVVDWARQTGAARVELWVTSGNDPAAVLYLRAGFVPTGRTQPLPSDPCQDENHMLLSLGSDRG
jgi:GNAT superfamily N-acetyltransferase